MVNRTSDPRDADQPLLSIIIPAFNEAERLPSTLQRIMDFVRTRNAVIEVVVVDNGSSDGTRDIVSDFAARYPAVRYLFEGVRGKGAAVRTGMMDGRGMYLLICDADLAVPIAEVDNFLQELGDYDIVIGSREAEGAKRFGEPFHRHLMGRIFNFIVRTLLLPGLHDTQCGFKCFRRIAARDLFSLSTIDGWSFDAEILYIARQRHYRIAELPVTWYYGERSKINPARDTWLMLKEVFRIRDNGRKGLYRT